MIANSRAPLLNQLLRNLLLANRFCRDAVSVVFAGCCLGCSDGPPRVIGERPSPNAAAAALEMLDVNKDGFIDATEVRRAPGLEVAMSRVDSNQDGKISLEEIASRLKAWEKSKIGRILLPCVFTHNGQPLPQASVSLVPETFLGGNLKPAMGVTNALGTVVLSSAAHKDEAQGVSLGFYRVEVTKQDGSIPAKFNVQTTLGIEVANDSAAISNGMLVFEIQ